MNLVSYTFSIVELEQVLMKYYSKNNIPYNKIYFDNSNDIFNLITDWCAYMSDQFFNDNPDVSDVLLYIGRDGENGIVLKEWMASR